MQSEVAAVARWSWEAHGLGLDLMNFSPAAWTAVSPGQVYWTPPAHMQPLSSRTVRFMVNIVRVTAEWRCIVRFGSTDTDLLIDRTPAIWIYPSTSRLWLTMTKSTLDGELFFLCNVDIVGPTFVTIVYTQNSMRTFINSVKKTDASCSPATLPSTIVHTDYTRKARNSNHTSISVEGFTMRSLQLLDFAMTDLEAQAPVIISVTPQVILTSHSSVTVIGSPFVLGEACVAMFLDGSISTTCNVVSVVEIVVTVNSSLPSTRPSMLTVIMHRGLIFRAPVSCFSPFSQSSETCAQHLPTANIKLSSYLTSDDAVVKLNWPDSSSWNNSGATLPTYDAEDGSWIFQSQFLDAGSLSFNIENGFTVSFMLKFNSSSSNVGIFNFVHSVSVFSIFMRMDDRRRPFIAATPQDSSSFSYTEPMQETLSLNTWYTFTIVIELYWLRVYINGAFRVGSVGVFWGPRSFSNCYIGKGSHEETNFHGRMKFFAVYDRALSQSEITDQHAMRHVPVFNRNNTLTLSFYLPPGSALKTIFVTDLQFSSFQGASVADATCSNLSPGVTVSPFFESRIRLLVLNLSVSASSASPSSSVVCRVSGFTNSFKSSISGKAKLFTFDSNGMPLQTHPQINFPEILHPRVVSNVSPSFQPSTAQLRVIVYGASAGWNDWSGGLRIRLTACASTSWQSDTLVLGRTATGAGFGWSITASVLLNQKSLTSVFSYSGTALIITSPIFLLPSTGAVLVTSSGMNLGTFNPSLSLKFGDSTCESSIWLSDSCVVSRISSLYSRLTSVVNAVTVAFMKSLFTRPIFVMSRNSSATNWTKHSNSPSTGGAHAFILGFHLGGIAFSAKLRFAGSAAEASHWFSDSCILLRTTGGVIFPNSTVVASFPEHNSTMIGTRASTLSYDPPTPTFAASDRLSNISVTGSNFGPYLAVVSRTTSCAAILPPNAISNICNSSALDTRDSGVTVTEASVSVSFSRPARLDDVTILMLSPHGAEFKLMQSKCFGSLPCPPVDVVSFNFQILPVGQLQSVPLLLCPSSGSYIPDDAATLRQALSSQYATGVWALRILTGSLMQNISFARILFKTASLEFRIANLPVTSLVWYSDSSMSMKAPGYLDVQGTESSSGFGRNCTVSAFSSGILSPSSCIYSYPDPAVVSIIYDNLFSSSGSTRVQLFGQHFSNVNSKPKVRAGLSSCVATQWLSDTSLTCNQLPSLGRIRRFTLSVEKSAIAGISTSYVPSQSVLSNDTFVPAQTATSLVIIGGSGLGMWDSSVRVRHTNSFSAATATIWLCDTRILTRVFHVVSNTPGIVFSLVSIVNNVSALLKPQFHPFSMTAYSKYNIPSTGSGVVVVSGKAFGSYSTSLQLSVGVSSCVASQWTSHSSVNCKTPSGYPGHTNARPLFFSSSGATITGINLVLAFDAPAVNGSANVFSENSNICYFNSSGCLSGKLVQLTHASSGFGTCAFPTRQFLLVQGSQSRLCDNSSWVSDSSIYCLFSASLSKEFRDFQVITESAASQAVTILNPFFIPAPPSMSNSTLQFRFYGNVMYPQDDKRYLDFGATSGFEWSDSSLALNVHHSEIVTFSFLVFLRASQFFMDSKFEAIETFVWGHLTVWSTVDVTSLVMCDQSAFKNISLSIRPRLFWTKMTVTLAFCAPQYLNSQSLTLKSYVIVRNARESLPLIAVSPAFLVNSAGTASIVLTRYPPAQVTAGNLYDDVLRFRFNYGTDLDGSCQQGGIGLFKYSIVLLCAGQKTSHFRSRLPETTGYIESTQCLQNVTGITFVKSSKLCRFNVSVVTDGTVFQVSPEFEVIPGRAEVAVLVGAGPFCASAGAIVWSVNSSSDGLCLVAQLQDAEGNNVTFATHATVIARGVHSLEPNYPVARSASNTSSALGVIRWCDAYSSKTQSAGVVFGARVNGNITYWSQSVINVSSIGLPSKMILFNSAAINNGTTLLPGAMPPKFSFSIEDAGGNNFAGSVRIAVRVRIVPRLNSTVGRSAAQMSVSMKRGARFLLQSINLTTNACDRDIPLEFTFFQSSNASHIVAGPDFLCRAGVNDIYFDIGAYTADLFSPIVLNAYTTTLSVISGEFKYFSLVNFEGHFIARSFTLIDSLEIVFIDAGMNEVSGRASMSLVCINSSAFVFPAQTFTAVTHGSRKSFVPPFFLYVNNWIPSETQFKISLTTANNSILPYGQNTASLHLNHSCSPGHHLSFSSYEDFYTELISKNTNANVSNAGTPLSLCMKCSNGTISNFFDAKVCRSVHHFYFSHHLTHFMQTLPSWNYSESSVHKLLALQR
jgi:hypothetical protein